MPYEIRYSTEALEDIGVLRAFDRSTVRDAVSQHLVQTPTRVSQSRIKRMTQPFWCQFRLRIGEFRVYYDVDEHAQKVIILRVAQKRLGSDTGELAMRAVKLTSTSSARELLPKDSEEVLVVENGHAVALVTPFDDDDAEWYARERDPMFLESLRRAREQAKRGETVSHHDLERLLSDDVDGVDLSGFESPVSVETLRRTKCSAVPGDRGVYIVLRPTFAKPEFLKKSVGGWFKGRDPSVPAQTLRKDWIEDATILYVGEADGAKGLKQRVSQFIQFGSGRNVGHWGGRYVWHLPNHRQLLLRWKATGKEAPNDLKYRIMRQFESRHGSPPFANLQE